MSYLDFFFSKEPIISFFLFHCTSMDFHSTLWFYLAYYIPLAILKAPWWQNMCLMGPYLHFSTLLSYDINNVLSKYCVKQEILNKSFFSLDFPAFTASVTFCAFNFQLISLRLHTNICKYFLLKYRAYKVSLMS